MKKFILFVSMLGICFSAMSQEKTTELSKEKAKEEYCMILATAKFLSTKVTIDIDFGQEWSFWKDKRGLRDENGKKIVFNSVTDALNYMASEGWEFVNAYVITVSGQNVYHYVMKRKLTDQDKVELSIKN